MKKLILFIMLILTSCVGKTSPIINNPTSHDLFTNDEINYIQDNNIDIDNLNKYLKYKTFNLYKYFDYEKIRIDYNYTHLESINFYNNPNYFKFYQAPKLAPFLNTSIVLINKSHYIERNFKPKNLVDIVNYNVDYIKRENENILLVKEVLEHYQQLYEDAKKQGYLFVVYSGYRSYDKQEHLFYNVNNENDSISAVPGFSEHHSGYAVDISTIDHGLTNYLEDSKEYNWLKNNCYKYGFILRFPKGKENITGYLYEPWHYRYVGHIAADIMNKDLTLEEFLFSNYEIK